MSKQALRDAFRAGWTACGYQAHDSRHPDLDAAFNAWLQRAMDTADRSPTPASAQPDREPYLDILCQQTNPPKPVAVSVLIERRPIVAVGLDEFKRCAADLERLERALLPSNWPDDPELWGDK